MGLGEGWAEREGCGREEEGVARGVLVANTYSFFWFLGFTSLHLFGVFRVVLDFLAQNLPVQGADTQPQSGTVCVCGCACVCVLASCSFKCFVVAFGLC